MRLFVCGFILFFSISSAFSSDSGLEPVSPPNTLPFDSWPIDALRDRENQLRDKIQTDSTTITLADSAEISFLLGQVKLNNRLSAICTFSGKLIVGLSAGASGLITALGWPSYLIYISSAIGGAGIAVTHYGEACSKSASELEKTAIAKHSADIIEYQKVHEARKRIEQQEVEQAKAENATVTKAVKSLYKHVMGIGPDTPNEDLDLSKLEAGLLEVHSNIVPQENTELTSNAPPALASSPPIATRQKPSKKAGFYKKSIKKTPPKTTPTEAVPPKDKEEATDAQKKDE